MSFTVPSLIQKLIIGSASEYSAIYMPISGSPSGLGYCVERAIWFSICLPYVSCCSIKMRCGIS